MLIRANQIAHLRKLVNFEDIPELVISTNEKPWQQRSCTRTAFLENN
jgi:hypothetical protein